MEEPETHLQIMAKIVNLFKKEEIGFKIRNCVSKNEMYDIVAFEEGEGKLGYSNLSKESIFAELETSEIGITSEESRKRAEKTGKNLLKKRKIYRK